VARHSVFRLLFSAYYFPVNRLGFLILRPVAGAARGFGMFEHKMLGVIGAGNMGQALIRGALKAGVVHRNHVVASRRNAAALQALQEELGIATTTDNAALLAECDVVLLCIKPQGFAELLAAHRELFRPDQLLISVAAGITTRSIEDAVGAPIPVIRVMPNTPALVGEGMSPYCRGRFANEGHALLSAQLLASVGKAVFVREELIDAATAVSGSGPAYVFYLVEAMQRAGEALGLPEHLAQALVRQTILGAAKLVVESADSPAELRRKVTSKGGTTAAAISVFENSGTAETVRQAMTAAFKRAGELGESSM